MVPKSVIVRAEEFLRRKVVISQLFSGLGEGE
jgi:hypothetical protein